MSVEAALNQSGRAPAIGNDVPLPSIQPNSVALLTEPSNDGFLGTGLKISEILGLAGAIYVSMNYQVPAVDFGGQWQDQVHTLMQIGMGIVVYIIITKLLKNLAKS